MIRNNVTADLFRPELLDFIRKSLGTAVKMTPVRDLATIRANQKKQYDHRVNYIPDYHTLRDPSLIVKGARHFLFSGGKWFNPIRWKIPNSAWAEYQKLLAERAMRKATTKAQFVNERAQARFLYARSWTEVGESLGLDIIANSRVMDSHTRRKPPEAPQRAKARIQGHRHVLNVIMGNPFLEAESRYKNFTGREIIMPALEAHKKQFDRNIERKLFVILRDIWGRSFVS